jgi:hypothetical protein
MEKLHRTMFKVAQNLAREERLIPPFFKGQALASVNRIHARGKCGGKRRKLQT